MLRRNIVLLIAICPSDGDVNPGGPLGAFREEQTMSQHWVSPSPFLSSSSHTTQLHYTNSYTYSLPNLNFLKYTIQILVQHVMWSAQAVCDSKIDHTQRHLSTLGGPWYFSRRAGYEPAPDITFSLPIIIIPHNTITLHKQLHIQSP